MMFCLNQGWLMVDYEQKRVIQCPHRFILVTVLIGTRAINALTFFRMQEKGKLAGVVIDRGMESSYDRLF